MEFPLKRFGYSIFTKGKLLGLKNKNGNIVLDAKYSYIDDVISHNGTLMVRDKNGDKVLINNISEYDPDLDSDVDENVNRNPLAKKSNVVQVVESIVKQHLAESVSNFDRDETYALYKLVQYAINKRISGKITGIDYTGMVNLLTKLKQLHDEV